MKKTILLIFLSFFLLLAYQNCGDDINLAKSAIVLPSEVLSTQSINTNICPVTGSEVSLFGKTVFIVDMSISNLGGRSLANPIRGVYKHRLGGEDLALDWDGDRFEAVEAMIDSLGSGDTKSFSVIGFHDSTIFNEGSCNSEFYGVQGAKDANNYLLSLQLEDKSGGGNRTTNSPHSPYNLKGTRYKTALDCLENKINFDILVGGNEGKSFYNVIFLTDGQPEDADDNNFAQQIESFYNRIQPDVLGMKFFPVYYGPQGGDEEAGARAVLEPLARVIDPDQGMVVTDDLSLLADELLSELSSTTQINYILKNFSTINLTAIPKNGRLKLDSNMNGVDDELEDIETAESIRDIFNSYRENLNEDGDNIPSFIEKLRGLRVDLNDDGLDFDLDGLTNIEELKEGRDLASYEAEHPTADQYLLKSNSSIDPRSLCDGGLPGYEYQIAQIPLVKKSIGFIDPSPELGIDFSYQAGNNLVLVYFVAEPLNAAHLKSKLYVALIELDASELGHFNLDPSTFVEIGEF